MSPYLIPSRERAAKLPGRRTLLQMALFAPLAAPRRARAGGTQSTATEAILMLNNGLLAVMKAGSSVPFGDRYNTLSRVVENTFDLPEILRHCVGPSWSTLSATEQAELLESVLTSAGVDHTLEFYPAQHGFAVPDNSTYDAAAAARHWAALRDLFGAQLR